MNTIDKILGIIHFIIEITTVFIANFIMCILILFPLTLILFPFNRNTKYYRPFSVLKMFYVYTFKLKEIV